MQTLGDLGELGGENQGQPLDQSLLEALDVRADRAQLLAEALVAAVEVIDAIDHRLAIGDEDENDEDDD